MYDQDHYSEDYSVNDAMEHLHEDYDEHDYDEDDTYFNWNEDDEDYDMGDMWDAEDFDNEY